MPVPDYIRAIWKNPPPGRIMGPGHPAGDFLGGPDWLLVEESPGRLVVDVPLVPAAKNFRDQLFGGELACHVQGVPPDDSHRGPFPIEGLFDDECVPLQPAGPPRRSGDEAPPLPRQRHVSGARIRPRGGGTSGTGQAAR